MKTIASRSPTAEEDYLELVRSFPLRPIRSKADHRRALVIVAKLSAKGDQQPTAGEADYLAALGRFVDDYERSHILPALAAASPLDVLHHLMDQHGMTPADLGEVLGRRPAATMILKGQREMSKAHIRAAASHFDVNPSVFL
jgi:HTH-type transcriptional regulator/antitoxin HigA